MKHKKITRKQSDGAITEENGRDGSETDSDKDWVGKHTFPELIYNPLEIEKVLTVKKKCDFVMSAKLLLSLR